MIEKLAQYLRNCAERLSRYQPESDQRAAAFEVAAELNVIAKMLETKERGE